MSNIDEMLAEMRLREARKQFINTKTGMYVEEDLIMFQVEQLFEDQARIMLPDTFEEMVSEKAQMKYPFEDRPQLIKTNSKGDVNFTFSIIPEPMPVDAERMIETISTILQIGTPSCKFYDHGTTKGKVGTIGWSDFGSNAMNGRVYNLVLITEFDKKILLGMFNCPFNKKHHWKPVFFAVMDTLEGGMKKNGYGTVNY